MGHILYYKMRLLSVAMVSWNIPLAFYQRYPGPRPNADYLIFGPFCFARGRLPCQTPLLFLLFSLARFALPFPSPSFLRQLLFAELFPFPRDTPGPDQMLIIQSLDTAFRSPPGPSNPHLMLFPSLCLIE